MAFPYKVIAANTMWEVSYDFIGGFLYFVNLALKIIMEIYFVLKR